MSSDNIVSLCYSVEFPSSHEGVDDDKMPLDMKLIKSTKRSLLAGWVFKGQVVVGTKIYPLSSETISTLSCLEWTELHFVDRRRNGEQLLGEYLK